MGISFMVSQLKQEMESVQKTLKEKKITLNSLRLQAGAVEAEIKKAEDQYTAY